MDDLISRQAAIEEAKALFKPSNYGYMIGVGYNHAVADCIAILNNLPSAQRTGRWIGREFGYCSCCGHEGCASDIWTGCENMFCHNCGARMEEQE